MTGLFSLGRRGNNNINNNNNEEEEEEQDQPNPPTEILPFWYNNKNDDVVSSYRGFELWNQQQQQQQQFFQQPQPLSLFQQQDLYSSAAALGVGPSRVSDEGPPSLSSRSGGGMSCQDCGNQAKKDCPHMRCRTCCKSRGFDCQTHLKSTWVPAAKRRERQQQITGLKQLQDGDEKHEDPHNSSLVCTRLPSNPSPTGEVNFPAVVSSPADFKCVRVSSVDDSEGEEYAYSTEVNIGGNVFRGILYDYGPDGNNYMPNNARNISSTGVEGALNFISATPTSTTTTTASFDVGAIVDPSSLYPAPLNTFMPPNAGGPQFFPHPRS